MEQQKIVKQILDLKKHFGSKLLIPGHYYMDPDLLAVADITGDSYQLSVKASRTKARFIVFCGVFFMAESARILCRQDQRVFIPDERAGCPLADTISEEYFRESMEKLAAELGSPPVPIVYVNSSAEIKALVGESGGTCCTSSNAALIIDSILKTGKQVFFLPDQNLGWNVAKSLGLADEQIGLMASKNEDNRILRSIKVALWDGYCPIHQRFSLQDIQKARSQYPGCSILVHPECTPQVVEAADFSGSTSQIFKQAQGIKRGSVIFIGTEFNFVQRLKQEKSDACILPLRESRCVNMAKITLPKLLSTLLTLSEEFPLGEVTVEDEISRLAREALQRMIRSVEERE